jgi:hypothetical protein
MQGARKWRSCLWAWTRVPLEWPRFASNSMPWATAGMMLLVSYYLTIHKFKTLNWSWFLYVKRQVCPLVIVSWFVTFCT